MKPRGEQFVSGLCTYGYVAVDVWATCLMTAVVCRRRTEMDEFWLLAFRTFLTKNYQKQSLFSRAAMYTRCNANCYRAFNRNDFHWSINHEIWQLLID